MGTKGMLLAYCLMSLWVILQLSQAKKNFKETQSENGSTMKISKESQVIVGLSIQCMTVY